MSIPPPGMTDIEIETLLEHVATGTVMAKTAVTLMVVNGEDRVKAARLVFQALGGTDSTELDPQGRPRYVGSGKLVSDVERAIADCAG